MICYNNFGHFICSSMDFSILQRRVHIFVIGWFYRQVNGISLLNIPKQLAVCVCLSEPSSTFYLNSQSSIIALELLFALQSFLSLGIVLTLLCFSAGALIRCYCLGLDLSVWYLLFIISLLFVKDSMAYCSPITGKFIFVRHVAFNFFLRFVYGLLSYDLVPISWTQAISFSDFFVADILTSMSKVYIFMLPCSLSFHFFSYLKQLTVFLHTYYISGSIYYRTCCLCVLRKYGIGLTEQSP